MNRERILRELYRLPVGMAIQFSDRTIRDAFPPNPFIGGDSRDRLMGNLPGSGYGEYTVDWDGMRGLVTVRRHNPGPSAKRVYTDPDRRHLYRTMPDGSLEYRHMPEASAHD